MCPIPVNVVYGCLKDNLYDNFQHVWNADMIVDNLQWKIVLPNLDYENCQLHNLT